MWLKHLALNRRKLLTYCGDNLFRYHRFPGRSMSSNKTVVAVCQMRATKDKDANLREAYQLLKEAADKKAEMVFYPEGFDFIGGSVAETLELSESLDGPVIGKYKEMSKEFNVWISLGGFHERLEDEGYVSNAHILINPCGELVSVYRKMHLFDVHIPEKNLHLQESSFVRPGQTTVVSPQTPIGRIGLGICYDIRFPEFSSVLRKDGASVLTYPSAFTVHTGKSHWEVLLRARAIENQCFVIAAAQVGQHNEKRASYGHSMIVDPWGVVVGSLDGEKPGVLVAEIESEAMDKIRKEMPVMSHKSPYLPHSIPPRFSIPENSDPDFFFGPIRATSSIVFLRTPHTRAFVNRRCVVPGHVLVSSVRVAERVEDLSAIELSDLFLLVQKVQEIMEKIHGTSSSNISIQDGKAAGQTVKHVHVHILPRQPSDFSGDEIYVELSKHDKGKVKWREYDEMDQEAEMIRKHIRQSHSHLLDHNSS